MKETTPSSESTRSNELTVPQRLEVLSQFSEFSKSKEFIGLDDSWLSIHFVNWLKAKKSGLSSIFNPMDVARFTELIIYVLKKA